MKNTIAVDLDGCICNTSARQHLLDESFEAYHSALDTDTPNEVTKAILRGLSDANYEIIVCTGRPAKFDLRTMAWLNKYGVEIDEILMRADNDWRSDAEVKISLLKDYFGSEEAAKESVLVYFETKDKTIETLRNNGWEVWQIQ